MNEDVQASLWLAAVALAILAGIGLIAISRGAFS